MLDALALTKKRGSIISTKTYFCTDNTIKSQEQKISIDVSREIIDILRERFNTDVKISSAVQLSASNRPNIVHKIILECLSNVLPNSLILKQFTGSQEDVRERFTRDWAGMEFLNKHEINSRKFYGGSKENCFILMENLGEKHFSLVDSLAANDPHNAIAALKSFTHSLGQLHARCYGKTHEYVQILEKINPNPRFLQHDLKDSLEYMIDSSSSILAQLNIFYSPEVQQEIANVIRSVLTPGLFSTFVHGDICPDNLFEVNDHHKNNMRIIDFEWSFVGNALLDGTYLAMSMPTCWCAKAIPKALVRFLEEIYRYELIKTIPAAFDDRLYYSAYTDACAYWMLKSVVSIGDILDRDCVVRSAKLPSHLTWDPENNLLRPRILSALQTFIDTAKSNDHLPHLQKMSSHLLEVLKIRWPDTHSLDFYPAFDLETTLKLDLTGNIITNDFSD